MPRHSKQEIAATAAHLLRAKGLHGTSMRDVADSVGLLKGSLYSHFTGKEELVVKAIEQSLTQLCPLAPHTGNAEKDYGIALAKFMRAIQETGRCLGLHIAYGLNADDGLITQAVQTFFNTVLSEFTLILSQNIDENLSFELSLETITQLEGATLWLVTGKHTDYPAVICEAMRAKVKSAASILPSIKARDLLNRLMGDWRKASKTEKELAEMTVAAQEEMRTELEGNNDAIAAASCFDEPRQKK